MIEFLALSDQSRRKRFLLLLIDMVGSRALEVIDVRLADLLAVLLLLV